MMLNFILWNICGTFVVHDFASYSNVCVCVSVFCILYILCFVLLHIESDVVFVFMLTSFDFCFTGTFCFLWMATAINRVKYLIGNV